MAKVRLSNPYRYQAKPVAKPPWAKCECRWHLMKPKPFTTYAINGVALEFPLEFSKEIATWYWSCCRCVDSIAKMCSKDTFCINCGHARDLLYNEEEPIGKVLGTNSMSPR